MAESPNPKKPMSCCTSRQCQGIEEIFDAELAADELEDYRRDGPSKTTLRLLDAIRAQTGPARSLLDIGGGVGAIQHALAPGLESIVNVDASPAYSQAARSEAERQGYANRADFLVGDFVLLAPEIAESDIVTLDRVLCCYDDMPALVDSAAGKARRVLGLVYPVDRVVFRAGCAAINFVQRILRRPFRMFIHNSRAVDDRIRSAGFRRKFVHRSLIWQVVVYAK